jgi:hypothetical protein
MRNKSCKYKHWKVKMITKEQRKQYLWELGKFWSCEHFVAKWFSAKMRPKVRKKRGSGEIFLQWELSIYRGEGGSFKNLPRFDRCEIPGGRVSTPTFWGWLFLLEFDSFNGSSELTRFPEGLVLGNSGKTFHPRNVGFAWFHEISFQMICENDSWIWLFLVNSLSVAGWSNRWTSRVMNLRRSGVTNLRRYGIMNLRRSRVMNPRRSGIMNLWRSGILNLRSFGIWNLRNHVSRLPKFASYGGRIRESEESQVKDVNSKNSGLACELVAGL